MKNVLFLAVVAFMVILVSCGDDGIFTDPIKGCTNPNAANYDAEAEEDDGSCAVPDGKVRPMLLEFTSKCCPPCGAWGHESFEHLYTTYGNDIVPVAVHTHLNSCMDPMVNETLLASFRKTFSFSGIPSFFIGNDKSYDEGTVDKYLGYNPIASSAFVSSKSGNTIKVKTVTNFHDNAQGDKYFGDYYIVAYAVESLIDGSDNADPSYDQAGHEGDTYYHNYVFRASSNPNNVYGDKIVAGEVADDAIIHHDMEIEINEAWKYNKMNVVVVLWFRQTNGTYRFINAIDN